MKISCAVFAFWIIMTSIQIHAKDKFNDNHLQQYLKKHPQGIIYLVSPHMYLALKGLPEYKAIADEKKIPFLVLLDPLATTQKNMLNIDLSKYSILDSKEIVERDGTQHYPSYIMYKNGKLKGKFNPGYDSPEKFKSRVNEYFRD